MCCKRSTIVVSDDSERVKQAATWQGSAGSALLAKKDFTMNKN
jgi:hypothetical protein